MMAGRGQVLITVTQGVVVTEFQHWRLGKGQLPRAQELSCLPLDQSEDPTKTTEQRRHVTDPPFYQSQTPR